MAAVATCGASNTRVERSWVEGEREAYEERECCERTEVRFPLPPLCMYPGPFHSFARMAGLSAQRPRPTAPRGSLPKAWSALFLSLAAGFFVLTCRQGSSALRKETRLMMDTYVTISVFAPGPAAAAGLDSAFARLEQIDHKFNHLDSTSPLYAFNERNVPITDPEIIAVLALAQRISALSGGAFDVTVEPLVRLWGFYGGCPAVPAQRQIDSCLRFVGYENLAIAGGRVTKRNPATRIDLGLSLIHI